MATYRKDGEYWTEVKRVVDGEVESTSCCCKDPGGTARSCMLWSGNKTPCRCHCHSLRHKEEKEIRKKIKEKK